MQDLGSDKVLVEALNKHFSTFALIKERFKKE